MDEVLVPLSEVLQALEDVEGIRAWRATVDKGGTLSVMAYVGYCGIAAKYLEQVFNYTTAPGDLVALANGEVLRIHGKGDCDGTPCPFHAPTKHHMVTWAMQWRGDAGMVERLCEHGIGHPDPDSIAFLETRYMGKFVGVHSCDGCCASGADLAKVS